MEPLFDSLFNRAPINAKSPFFIRAFFAPFHRGLALLDSQLAVPIVIYVINFPSSSTVVALERRPVSPENRMFEPIARVGGIGRARSNLNIQ